MATFTHLGSFGVHPNYAPEKALSQGQLEFLKKIPHIQELFLQVFLLNSILSVIGVFSISSFVPGLAVYACAKAALTIVNLYFKSRVCKTAGILSSSEPDSHSRMAGKVEITPTRDSQETLRRRIELIKRAEHNILISGNYCSGKACYDMLQAIEKRMREKPSLKVLILCHPSGVKDKENEEGGVVKVKSKFKELKKEFRGRFQLVKTGTIYHISPSIKRTTNHCKAFVVDFGRHFILGGSGIEDKYNCSGRDSLSSEERFSDRASVRSFATAAYRSMTAEYAEDAVEPILPRKMRDQDFVFSSLSESQPAGYELFRQMLFLANRWGHYNEMMGKRRSSNISQPHGLIKTLLNAKVPDVRNSEEVKRVEGVACRFFFTGPEFSHSLYAQELESQIESAKDRIVISNLYFFPSESFIDKLVEAVKRGVNITIITNGLYANSPGTHHNFGHRNRYNAYKVLSRLDIKDRRNVHYFEFEQEQTSLHKKVFVIDNHVFAGSSNCSYKSLVITSDHEINFQVHSEKVANRVVQEVFEDKCFSRRIKQEDISFSLSDRLRIFNHWLFQYHWG